MDGQLELPNSFGKLKDRHFPLFTTVQKLIYMIDGALPYSFFTRDCNGNILGMDSTAGWHGEQGNVLMINQHHKQNIDFDSQIGRFGEQLM